VDPVIHSIRKGKVQGATRVKGTTRNGQKKEVNCAPAQNLKGGVTPGRSFNEELLRRGSWISHNGANENQKGECESLGPGRYATERGIPEKDAGCGGKVWDLLQRTLKKLGERMRQKIREVHPMSEKTISERSRGAIRHAFRSHDHQRRRHVGDYAGVEHMLPFWFLRSLRGGSCSERGEDKGDSWARH